MKPSTSLLLSTLVISTVVFESAFAVTKNQSANKQQTADQMKIKLVKAKNVQAPAVKKTNTVVKAATNNNLALDVSTKSAPKIAASAPTTNIKKAQTVALTTPSINSAVTNTSDTENKSALTDVKSTTSAKSTEQSSFVTFNVSTGIVYTMGAEEPKNGKRSSWATYDIWPAVTIGPVKTTLLLEYSQDLNENKNSDWAIDPQFFFASAKPIPAGSYVNLSPAAFVILPAMKSSREVNQLKYAYGANTTIALNTKTLGWDGFVLQYQPGYLKNENDFSTSTAGAPLTSYRIRHRFNFWAPISTSFIFKTRFQFDSNFSFENVVRNNFLHFEQIDYKFLDKYAVYLGHSNLGPTLQGENYEDNLKFYDGESSSFYLGLWADF